MSKDFATSNIFAQIIESIKENAPPLAEDDEDLWEIDYDTYGGGEEE